MGSIFDFRLLSVVDLAESNFECDEVVKTPENYLSVDGRGVYPLMAVPGAIMEPG